MTDSAQPTPEGPYEKMKIGYGFTGPNASEITLPVFTFDEKGLEIAVKSMNIGFAQGQASSAKEIADLTLRVKAYTEALIVFGWTDKDFEFVDAVLKSPNPR